MLVAGLPRSHVCCCVSAPVAGFVSVIKRLLQNADPTIRRKALDLLRLKVEHQGRDLEDEEVALFVGMLAGLDRMLRGKVVAGGKGAIEGGDSEEVSLARNSRSARLCQRCDVHHCSLMPDP